MAQIIGDSFGGLQQTKQYYDQLNTRLQQDEAARAQAAYQFQAQQQQAAQRQQDENNRQAQAQYFQSVQSQNAQADQDKASANAAYQFNANQSEQQRRDAENAREFNVSEADNKTANTQKTQYAQDQRNYSDALKDIASGAFDDDPAKLGATYSHLPPQSLVALGQELDARIKGNQQGYDTVQAQVDAANLNVPAVKMSDRMKLIGEGANYNESPSTGTNFTMRATRPMTAADRAAAMNVVTPPVSPTGFSFPTSAIPPTTAPGAFQFGDQSALPDTSAVVSPATPPPSGAPVVVTSQDQFDALPPGTLFINPADGSVRRKKAANASP